MSRFAPRRQNPWPKGSPGYWLVEAQTKTLTQGVGDMPFIFVLAMTLSFGGGFVLSWAIPQVNPLLWWLLFTSLALGYWVWARRRYWPVGELNQWLAGEDAQLDPGDRLPPISQSGGGEGSDLRSVAVRARQRLF